MLQFGDKGKNSKEIGALLIGKSSPWGLFDRAKQVPPSYCCVGGVSFLPHRHFINFKACLDLSSDNIAKLMAFRCLSNCQVR